MTGLIGWWPLHETSSNTARDLSGNGNHGSLNGGVTQGVAGKAGLNSYGFDGEDDYVSHTPTITTPITISLWVKFDSIDSPDFVLGHWDGTNQMQLGWKTSSEFDWHTYDGSYHGFNDADIGINQDKDKWHHIVALHDGKNYTLYIDGNKKASIQDSTFTPPPGPYFFGARNNQGSPSGFSNSNICDLRIYNRALSPQEIRNLYVQGSSDFTTRSLSDGSNSGAVSRWKLSDGGADGSTAEDFWRSNTGDINGSGWSFSNDSVRNNQKSLRNDGSNDFNVQVSDDSSLDITSEITVSTWCKFTNVGQNKYEQLLTKDSASNRFYWMFKWRSGHGNYNSQGVRFDINTEDGRFATYIGHTPKGDVWVHYVGTYNGSEMKMYENGELKHVNSSASGAINTGSGDLRLGNNEMTGGDRGLEGRLSDVRIYNRALKPWEIFELYRWGTKGIDMRKKLVNARGKN